MDRADKMRNDLLNKDKKKRKKKSKELFDNNSKSKNKSNPKTPKQFFNKKHNQPLGKSNTLEEISKLSGFKKSGLQKIYNKGIGAAKTAGISRPNVTSKEQWAYGRVYSAVTRKGGAYKFDKDLLIKR